MDTSDLHIPVMLQEVVESLAPQDGQHFVDATFGNGGYSEALLARAKCTVSAFDRDPDAIERGRPMAARYDAGYSLSSQPLPNLAPSLIWIIRLTALYSTLASVRFS